MRLTWLCYESVFALDDDDDIRRPDNGLNADPTRYMKQHIWRARLRPTLQLTRVPTTDRPSPSRNVSGRFYLVERNVSHRYARVCQYGLTHNHTRFAANGVTSVAWGSSRRHEYASSGGTLYLLLGPDGQGTQYELNLTPFLCSASVYGGHRTRNPRHPVVRLWSFLVQDDDLETLGA